MTTWMPLESMKVTPLRFTTIRFHCFPWAPVRRWGANAAVRVAPVALAATVVQARGPRGAQPKKWLMPGVWTTARRAAVEAAVVARTRGLRQ